MFVALSGVDDWVGMECFAEEKEAWFRQFLSLNNGIPSHDTLSDVMGRIQYEAFAQAFLAWSQTALPSLAGEQIAIDVGQSRYVFLLAKMRLKR